MSRSGKPLHLFDASREQQPTPPKRPRSGGSPVPSAFTGKFKENYTRVRDAVANKIAIAPGTTKNFRQLGNYSENPALYYTESSQVKDYARGTLAHFFSDPENVQAVIKSHSDKVKVHIENVANKIELFETTIRQIEQNPSLNWICDLVSSKTATLDQKTIVNTAERLLRDFEEIVQRFLRCNETVESKEADRSDTGHLSRLVKNCQIFLKSVRQSSISLHDIKSAFRASKLHDLSPFIFPIQDGLKNLKKILTLKQELAPACMTITLVEADDRLYCILSLSSVAQFPELYDRLVACAAERTKNSNGRCEYIVTVAPSGDSQELIQQISSEAKQRGLIRCSAYLGYRSCAEKSLINLLNKCYAQVAITGKKFIVKGNINIQFYPFEQGKVYGQHARNETDKMVKPPLTDAGSPLKLKAGALRLELPRMHCCASCKLNKVAVFNTFHVLADKSIALSSQHRQLSPIKEYGTLNQFRLLTPTVSYSNDQNMNEKVNGGSFKI